MKNYKIASSLMIVHGGLMEIGGCLFALPMLLTNNSGLNQYFTFIVPYFQDNLILMLVMGLLYGIIRIIGAVGLWKNRMWGLILSIINCIITLTLIAFMLPAGILDGVFAGIALALILMQYFGKQEIRKGTECSSKA